MELRWRALPAGSAINKCNATYCLSRALVYFTNVLSRDILKCQQVEKTTMSVALSSKTSLINIKLTGVV